MARTLYPTLLVLALGAAAAMWGMSGMGSLYGTGNPADDLQSGERLEERANDSAVQTEDGFQGEARGADDGDIVGLTLSAGSAVMNLVGLVVLLPFELINLGVPRWMALPAGFVAQIIASVGLVQFITGRVWE